MKQYKIKAVGSVFWGHAIDMLMLGIPFASLILAGFYGYIPDRWFMLSYVVAGALILLLLVRQMRRFRYLKCPGCTMQLVVDPPCSKPWIKFDNVTFTCEKCRTVWKTDFILGTD